MSPDEEPQDELHVPSHMFSSNPTEGDLMSLTRLDLIDAMKQHVMAGDIVAAHKYFEESKTRITIPSDLGEEDL